MYKFQKKVAKNGEGSNRRITIDEKVSKMAFLLFEKVPDCRFFWEFLPLGMVEIF